MNNKILGCAVAISTVCLAVTQPVLAADLFANAKVAIKESAGTGSSIETAMLSVGLLGGMATGYLTKNWLGGIGGFAAGMIFWKFAAPIVGL